MSAQAKKAPGHVVRVSYEELQANLSELEAKFDKLFEARQQMLRALEGRSKPTPRPRPEPVPSRSDVAANCREQARRLIDDELNRIDREIGSREWELSPRAIRLHKNQERLRTLASDLDVAAPR
jgi:hypothetical protein